MCGQYLLGNMLSALYNKNFFYEVPVNVKYSHLCEEVLMIMKDNGYIERYDVVNNEGKKSIDIILSVVDGKKNINFFKLISKLGCRVYMSVKQLKKMSSYNPYSLVLVSTSKGVKNISDAITEKIGGEVLCEIF